MTMYDNIWQYMTIYDNILQYMTIYDNIWQYMTIYDNVWQYMTVPCPKSCSAGLAIITVIVVAVVQGTWRLLVGAVVQDNGTITAI